MIPDFPEFKKVGIEDNDDVESYTRNFPYYSDFNFSSLWSWDISQCREVSILNESLVVKFTDYETGEPFLSYLGMKNNTDTALKLLEYSESIGLPPILQLMPEISIHDIDSPLLKISTDRANYDYVYLIERLASLKGNEYKSKRQSAEHFAKAHINLKFEIRSLKDIETQISIRAIAKSWRDRRDPVHDDQSIVHEVDAIENIIKLASVRDIFVGFVIVDGVATGFTVEEVVNKIFSISHFWKTAKNSRGEYEYMAREMAKYLDQREVTYWNWEQDLGIESLRASKSSYRPSDFLKKFTIVRSSPESTEV